MKLTADKLSRFWAKVDKGGASDCWLWTAARSSCGYGRFAAVGQTLYAAHRVSFELAGNVIPEGLVIDHMCRNRLCVNPAHLRAVDRFTNVHENSAAPAHINSLKTNCPRGHALSGQNLVIDRGKRRCRTCKAAALRNIRSARKGESGIKRQKRGSNVR